MRKTLILAMMFAAALAAASSMNVANAQVFEFWNDQPKKKKRKPVAKKPDASAPAAATAAPAAAAATAATSSEAAKVEPAKAEASARDSAEPDVAKTEAVLTEPAKPEPAKSEPATPEPSKIEPATAEPAKPDASPPATAPAQALLNTEAEEAKAAAEKAKAARAAAEEAKDAAKKAKEAADQLKKTPEASKEIVVPTAPRADADAVVAAAFRKLDDKAVAGRANKDDIIAAKVFYGERTGPALWTAADGLNAKSRAVITEFSKAEDWGLDPKDFPVPDLANVQTTPETLGEAEAKLTLAALTYARYARGGRVNPQSISRIWDQVPPIKDPAETINLLATREDADAVLRDLHPKHQQFQQLRSALLKLRGPAVPEAPIDPALLVKLPSGKSIKPTADHADIALLRQRLKVPAEAGAKETLYDPKLVDAVKAFQKDKGLDAGGILNQATRNALNAEGEQKKPNPTRDAQRILINMERWRWMPENLGEFYVWNNAPEFMVRVVKDGNVIHKDKIIVGQPTWPTPVFSADMLYIIFNPEWGMPDGIKLKELKPRLQASGGGFFDSLFGGGGGSVIRAYGLRVSYNGRSVDPDSVDWSSANLSNYSFVQPAGPKNPLGVVKFRFPNRHDVYMHDTPERELFARSYRALSHGCIRVNNPTRFAQLLLDHDRKGGQSTGDATLNTPIPVHITYFTAMADENGNVSTFGDIYGFDSRLSGALGGKAIPYDGPAYEPVEASTVAAEDSSEAPVAGNKKKRKQSSSDSLQDAIQSIFLN